MWGSGDGAENGNTQLKIIYKGATTQGPTPPFQSRHYLPTSLFVALALRANILED